MSLKHKIFDNYVDVNRLVAPYPCNFFTRASDNGVMFTAELLILLKLRGELDANTQQYYVENIKKCFLEPGLISRAPNDRGQSPPDDHFALGAMGVILGYHDICKDILSYGLKHFGSFNNENPGKWTSKSFLWRMPQLLACIIAGAGKKVPLILCIYSALVLLFSCRKVEPNKSDERRLAWLLSKALSNQSLLVRLASKVWFNRLRSHYGPEGMKAVRSLYYHGMPDGEQHPFTVYSVD